MSKKHSRSFLRGKMVEESLQWQGSWWRALGRPESGRVAVGSVGPYTHPPGAVMRPGFQTAWCLPVPAPQTCHAPWQEGWVGSPQGRQWSNRVRVPGEQGAPRHLGRMSSQGGPRGQGPGQEWAEDVTQVGPARDWDATEFLLPAASGSVLQLHPPGADPCPQLWRGAGGVSAGLCMPGSRCRQWSMASPPAQRLGYSPSCASGHRHPAPGCQAVSFLSSWLPPREALEGLGALALLGSRKTPPLSI